MVRRVTILLVVALVAAAPAAAFLHYFLPRHDVVRIVNTEVRRVDSSGKPLDRDRTGASRDVFYIFAEEVDSREPRVYRNEDTGWGFPFYFKFNSADVQAVAASVAGDKSVALVTRYGWRNHWFSWFPNAVSVRRWDPADAVTPWFNIFFFATLGGAALWLWLRVRRSRSA